MMMLAAICHTIVTAPASARSVQDALAHYEALEFEEVIPNLKQALADPELARDDRILALAYLGRTRAIFRRTQAAHRAFIRLLDLAPDYALDEFESPLIQQAFAVARARWQTRAHRQEEAEMAVAASEAAAPEPPDPPASAPPPLDALTEPLPPRAEPETASRMTLWVVLGASAAVLAAGSLALAVTRPWESSEASLGTLTLP